ncbi:MAG: right-handed parallel beta-helix repeat-containing protein [Phycisphaerae bacterium]|nr:right-handed parallel beta-helix repeat-containing protein [Phycisphaerae bacterium]
MLPIAILLISEALQANPLTSTPAPLVERLSGILARGHRHFEAGDWSAARGEYGKIAGMGDAPGQWRSIAQLRIAECFVRAGNLDSAKDALAKVASIDGAPPHHCWEAQERIDEITRVQAGQPARDPTASRIRLPRPPKAGVELHVAPNGVDTQPGTRQQPFRTLERARDEIRAIKKRGGLPAGGVAVVVHGGDYKVARPFALTAEDSGTEKSPIVYRADEGQRPRFVGGVRLSGPRPVEDAVILARLPEEARGKVLQIDLKAHGIKDLKPLKLGGFASGSGFATYPMMELFFDGKPMTLARWPNEGFVRMVDVVVKDGHKIHGLSGSKVGQFIYEGDRPLRWKDETNGLLYGYWFWGWADSYERITAVDTDKRIMTLAEPYAKWGYRKGQPYHALNMLCEIDSPGEWYLDRTAAMLYFWPPSDPAKGVIELSVADFPAVRMDDVSHVTLRGLTWDLGCVDGIKIKGGDHCLLAGCTVRRFGGNGVTIDGGMHHGLLSCDIHSMGRGGAHVMVGDRTRLAPGHHFIENCHIHDLSRVDHTYTPAVGGRGVGMRIAHNLMHDVRSSAINFTGNDHVIEFNEIHDVVLESDDQGGVDMFGDPTYRGNVYRYNYFHHIGHWRDPSSGPACGQAGIRLDDAISGTLLYGNVFYRCSAGKVGFGGVQIHGGKENIVDGNVFVGCMAALSFSAWPEARWREHVKKSLEGPEIKDNLALYVSRYPALARLSEDCNVNMIWRNLAYRCGEFIRRDPRRLDLIDNCVTNDDPGFVDAAGGRFQLKEGAPGWARTGLRAIPFDEIGLYRDEYRGDVPAR